MRYFTVIKAHIATFVDEDRCGDDLPSGKTQYSQQHIE